MRVQCIGKPTRTTELISSCIDYIFVRYCDMKNMQTAILQTSETDHYCTKLTISATGFLPTTHTAYYNTTTYYMDHFTFTNILAQSDLNKILNIFDVNECSSELHSLKRCW